MKKITILLFFFLFIINYGCNRQKINEIEVFYINPNIETPIRIDENTFETFFHDDIDSCVIKAPSRIMKIESELNHLKPANVDSFSSPDVRIKLVLCNSSEGKDTICIGRFVVQYENQIYVLSSTLRNLLYTEIGMNR